MSLFSVFSFASKLLGFIKDLRLINYGKLQQENKAKKEAAKASKKAKKARKKKNINPSNDPNNRANWVHNDKDSDD